jgi:diadenosine tetraphosphate (Ap4A) HIT family hydrolase
VSNDDCGICRLIASSGPDQTLLESEHFVVTTAMDVPGWCMVSARRHEATSLWGLSTDESAALGPLMTRLAGVLHDALGAERVYTLAFGEHALHFHILLQPRTPDVPAEERGPALFGTAAARRDPAESLAVAGRLRTALEAR